MGEGEVVVVEMYTEVEHEQEEEDKVDEEETSPRGPSTPPTCDRYFFEFFFGAARASQRAS